MASKTKNVKRPENMQHTLRIFVSYLGRHKFMLLIVSNGKCPCKPSWNLHDTSGCQ